MSVVTRYAPSPTGPLHIGGARTALFSWAFARHHAGRFLVRLEDTDRARSTEESERAVLEALDWLGLGYDPAPGFAGIPRQSERQPRYQALLSRLLETGAAYRCSCTAAEVEAMRVAARAAGRLPAYDGSCRDRGIGPDPGRPFCVRLRIPENGNTRWNDLVAGPSGQERNQLDDFVIARSDGTPIYHLAVVVDDHDMGVTHVIRGREHMTSTPRQLLLYAALGFEPPQFAHVPLLVEAGGKKLSKRHASVSVQSYRDRGFTAEAVLNFLARLGWAHGDLEIFSGEQLCELFDLDDVGRAPAQIDEEKLLWVNQQYLKSLPADTLLDYLKPFLEVQAGRSVRVDDSLRKLVDLLRERSKTLLEMASQADFWLADSIEIEPKAARKYLRAEIAAPLAETREAFAELPDWNETTLEQAFHRMIEKHALKLGQLAQPIRVALVGRPVSPGLFETLDVVGRSRSLARIDAALEQIRPSGPQEQD